MKRIKAWIARLPWNRKQLERRWYDRCYRKLAVKISRTEADLRILADVERYYTSGGKYGSKAARLQGHWLWRSAAMQDPLQRAGLRGSLGLELAYLRCRQDRAAAGLRTLSIAHID